MAKSPIRYGFGVTCWGPNDPISMNMYRYRLCEREYGGLKVALIFVHQPPLLLDIELRSWNSYSLPITFTEKIVGVFSFFFVESTGILIYKKYIVKTKDPSKLDLYFT